MEQPDPPEAVPAGLACPRCSSVRVKGVLRHEPVGYLQCTVCQYVWSTSLKRAAGVRWEKDNDPK